MNYAIEYNQSFNSDKIDLEGLVAKWSKTSKFDTKPIIKHTEQFDIIEIQGRRGVFVVQFTGSGLKSQAVIRIGSLTTVTHVTPDGLDIMIVNDKKETCLGKNTGLYIDKKQILVNPETGIITLPFEQVSNNKCYSVVLFHDDFADTHKLEVPNQTFRFKSGFFYNKENIRPGQICTILFQAKLFMMENMLVMMDRIIDTSMEVIIINESDVTTSTYFKNFALSYVEDYPVKFIVPAKTVKIELRFRGKMETQKGTFESFMASKIITIDRFGGDTMRLNSIYLNNEANGYSLKNLGKNGEAFPNEMFNLTIKRTWHSNTKLPKL